MEAAEYFAVAAPCIEALKKDGLDQKSYSDAIDKQGQQYIDLVMEGGGVLGVALLGYIYVLEQAHIRFLGIGGTSAGSITALALAAIDEPCKAKAQRLTELVANMPMDTFIDGDADAKEFVSAMLERAGPLTMGFKGLQVLDNLKEDLGLNPGNNFYHWIKKTLDDVGIDTVTRLRRRMLTLPDGGLIHRKTREPIPYIDRETILCLITADISTETRVELPKMASLYWKYPDSVHPALFARASMSIPIFFHPLIINDLPRDAGCRQRWVDLAGFDERAIDEKLAHNHDWLPTRCLLVDGGVMSNFPIDAFHDYTQVPRWPTFGAKLEWDDRSHEITKPTTLIAQILNSARHTLDYEFIKRNVDYKHLVCFIDTADHDWLDFSVSDQGKLDLFRRGAEAALGFLRKFNWDDYKKVRGGLIDAHRAAKKN